MRTAAAPQRAAAASAAARADLCTWPRRAAGAGAAHRGACAWEQRAGVGAPVALCSRRAGAAFFAGCGAPSVAGACGGCARAAVGAVGGSARRGCARAAERSKATRAVDAAFGGALLRAGGPALVGRCSCVARRRGPRWRARGAHRCCMGLHRLVRRPRDRCQRNASLPIDGALGASEASGACQRSKTLKVPIIAKRTESPSSSALLTPFTSTPHSRCVRTLRAACARLRGARLRAASTWLPSCQPLTDLLSAMASKLVKLSMLGLGFAGWSAVLAGTAILQARTRPGARGKQPRHSGASRNSAVSRARAPIGRDCAAHRVPTALVRARAAAHARIGRRRAQQRLLSGRLLRFDFDGL